ncbi:unnamed protein product [Clavelina lepadiformis]|uniref:Fibrinogen C-terminal domain-containing protein n=1 Tax=Clavelina lepadiformis TaxID=159417 RepID=A0ABP0GJA9_CLALP
MQVLFLLTFFPILLALVNAKECRQVALCGQELRNFDEYFKLKDFLLPASCYTSSVYGRQTLRSGEEAFCDEGWTVFQRRFNGSVNFQRNWADYKSGFGSMDGEYWLGLDKVHAITRGRGCKLRVDLWDFTNDHRFAEYSMFSVEDESDLYRLHIGGYSGTAGDSMASGSNSHNNQRFSTYNVDNDNSKYNMFY